MRTVGRVDITGDLPEVRAVQRGLRKTEIDPVLKVERFAPNFQCTVFPNGEPAADTEAHVEVVMAIDVIGAEVAESACSGRREGIGIQLAVWPLCRAEKEEAIVALLTQRNMEEAARTTGISTKTLLRWLQVPEFDAAYRKARRDAYSQSRARLQQACGAAVSTLLKVMVDPGTPPSTRVRAADSVLDHAAKAIELEDIEVRVADLERSAEASKLAPTR